MKNSLLLILLLLSGGQRLLLVAQSSPIQLNISSSRSDLGASPATLIVTAVSTINPTPISVHLHSANQDDEPVVNVAQMKDDGAFPDQVSNDGIYTCSVSIPLDKLGSFRFLAVADMGLTQPSIRSNSKVHAIGPYSYGTADGLFVDLVLGETDIVFYDMDAVVRKFKIYRTEQQNGPWTLIHEESAELSEAGKIDRIDTDYSLHSQARYYKVETYDANNTLVSQYTPLRVPGGSPDSLLILNADFTSSYGAVDSVKRTKVPDGPMSRAVSSATPWDWAWITTEDFLCFQCMSLAQIRDLFAQKNSFLQGTILDTDGVPIDVAEIVYAASQENLINPQILLAKLQGENGAIFSPTRLDDRRLKTLMGCGGQGGNLQTNIRTQINCAANKLKTYFDQILLNNETQSGWKVGQTKNTVGKASPSNPVENLPVTPANAAIAALFTYTPYRGAKWGASNKMLGGNGLLENILRNTLKLYAMVPWMGHELLDSTGAVVHKFLTHDVDSGEYTLNWNMDSAINENTAELITYPSPYGLTQVTTYEGNATGVLAYLPGRPSYTVTLKWDLYTWDYCKLDPNTGNATDGSIYNGDCFYAAILDDLYDSVRATFPEGPTGAGKTYTANLLNLTGAIGIIGGTTMPPLQTPYVGAAVQHVNPSSPMVGTVTGNLTEGKILNVGQDSDIRKEITTFPTWGKVSIKVK